MTGPLVQNITRRAAVVALEAPNAAAGVLARLATLEAEMGARALSLAEVGAEGDGVADDTEFVREWLAEGGRRPLWAPAGDYLIRETTGSEILLIDKPPRILGAGASLLGANFIVASDVPTTIDALAINPSGYQSGQLYFGEIAGIRIRPQSGNPGRDALRIQLDDGTPAEFLAQLDIHHNWLGSLSRRAISFFKGDGTNAPSQVDGLFTSTIRDNILGGGPDSDYTLYLLYSGDSLQVDRNIFTGPGCAVFSQPVGGALQQTYKDNNLTTTGGFFHFKNARQITVRNNQMELGAVFTGSLEALIVLENCLWNQVRENNIAGAEADVPLVLLKSSSVFNTFEDNFMACDADSYHFELELGVGALNNLGRNSNRYQVGLASGEYPPRVLNGSPTVPQIGLKHALTLQNSWAAHADTNYHQGLYATLDDKGRVSFHGQIAGGTNTSGTVIAQLPDGMRPLNEFQRIFVRVFNTGAWTTWSLVVNLLGQIIIEQALPATTLVSFDSSSFLTY